MRMRIKIIQVLTAVPKKLQSSGMRSHEVWAKLVMFRSILLSAL